MQPTAASNETQTHDLSVLVFGMQARALGSDRLTLTGVSLPISCEEVLALIAKTQPDLAASVGVSRLAINHEFANPETLIHEGDEVALVGLISGG